MLNKLKISFLTLFILGTFLFGWGYFNIDHLSLHKRSKVIPPPQIQDTSPEAVKAKINKKVDIPEIFTNMNIYFSNIKRPSITQQSVPEIDGKILLKELDSHNNTLIVIDIREKYEQSLLKLNNYSNIHYIPFGDLINNKFNDISKDANIVIIGYTENREIAAASYLLSEGYKNVQILKGGLLQWVTDKLPTSIDHYSTATGVHIQNKDLASELRLYSQADIDTLGSSVAALQFGTYGFNKISMLLWDTNTIKEYIQNLPKDKKYILYCKENTANVSCWEAIYFWYIAKDKINIIGYTLY